MKLHSTAIEKLIKTFELYGGRKDQAKLKEHLQNINFVAYERKENGRGKKVLVTEEELRKELNPNLR